MEFQTHYTRTIRSAPERNSGQTLVEKAGYISARERIENMILAGQRLVDSRRARHDFAEGEPLDESFTDPTRARNFDLADATQMQLRTDYNIAQSAALAQTEADAKATQTQTGASGAVTDSNPE